ncbi:MAG: prephenate dehydrogenase/arogenate dehydrogenase family protein, partial [Chloroflexi bacterium]|nr:prephenate dehydrogenase/arogenate dehydrogenase family protein [Chloroflexota bacterium]
MNITIVGLGTVGVSLGLALKAIAPDVTITGHDPDPERAKRAQDLGAVDKRHWNLPA